VAGGEDDGFQCASENSDSLAERAMIRLWKTLDRECTLGEIFSQGIVDYDGPAIGEGFGGMTDGGGDDRDEAWADYVGDAVYGQFEFALDYFPNFFLRMKVFVDGCTLIEVVVREGHARRVEIASAPTWQALNYAKTANVYDGHGGCRRVYQRTSLHSMWTQP
jgi:hypothetical protein